MGVQGIPMIASAFRTKPKSATERKTTATASIVFKNDFIDLLLSSNLVNQKSEIRISKSETIFKIRNIKHKTETRREVVLDIRFFWSFDIVSNFGFRASNLQLCAFARDIPKSGCGSAALLLFAFLFGLRLRRSVGQVKKLDFLGAFGRRENELLIGQLRRQVPTSYYYRERRLPFNLFRGENEFARQGFVSVLDPDLPVNLRCAKRQMSCLGSCNNARADHRSGGGGLEHLVSGICVQQICAGRDYIELFPREIEHLIQGRRCSRGGIEVLLRIVKRQGLAVVKEFLVQDVTLAMGAQLVRTRHNGCRGTVKLHFLPRSQHGFERALRLQAKLLAARKVIAHPPQQFFSLRIDPGRLRVSGLGPSSQHNQRQNDC